MTPDRVGMLQGGRVALGRLPLILAGIAALLLLAGPATAKQKMLEEAKAAGQVGEQFDGYVGIVAADIPAPVQKMVSDTNERRKAKYEKVAETRGIPIVAVEKLAGAKLIDRALPGEYVKQDGGEWQKVGQ